MELQRRYQLILDRIQKQVQTLNPPVSPTLLAVSKGQAVDRIEELYHLGHRDFAENYAQELVEKAVELSKRGCVGIKWHFIGHLQSNKVKLVIPFLSSVHTVHSIKLANELSKKWNSLGKPAKLPVFVETNIDREISKSGVLPDQVVGLTQEIAQFEGLKVLGLMCIPNPNFDPRSRFQELRALEQKCRPHTQGMLSMGMSQDFETAIQEGSSHTRIGTALFGPRNLA